MSVPAAEVAGEHGGIAVRDGRPDDATAIMAAMLAARARGEYPAVEPYQLEHAVDRMVHSDVASAVAEVDGDLAGWVIPGDGDLVVLPQHRRRGVGRRLVEAARDIARRDGQDRVRLWVRDDPGSQAFAAACGLRFAASLWQLRLDGTALAAAPPPRFPAGILPRSLRADADVRPFVRLVNAAFADHPSPIELTEAEVRRVNATPGFLPGSVLVVEDGATGTMVAFCRVVGYQTADGTPAGEIRLLGVDPAWRGRGLGRAVTAWGVDTLRDRGAEAVVLAVEGENASALRLYERLGFRAGAEWRHWSIGARDPER